MNARIRRLLLLSVSLPVLSLAFAVAPGCAGDDDRGPRLAAPTMVAATGGDGHITLSWAQVEGASRYLVYSAREPNVTPGDHSLDGYRRDTVGGDETGFTLEVENGEIRWFVMSAVNARSREGDLSAEVFGIATPWERPDPLEIGSGDALSPRIAADPTGGLTAVWTRLATQWEVHVSRFTDMWSPVEAFSVVDSAGTLARAPRVAAAAGTAVVVWQQGNGVSDRIYSVRYASGSWGTPQRIDDQPGGARNPELAIDGDGDALAVWVQSVGSEQDIRAASLAAGVWSATSTIDDAAEPGDEPRVGADAAGNGLAVWTQNGAVRASRWTGTWAPPVLVTTTSARASSPSLAVHPETGDAMAVWLQTDAQNDTDVWAARFDVGTGWSAPVQVESHPLAAASPSVALHASGRAIATWLQRSGSRDVVTTARFLPAEGWSAPVFHDAVAEANAGSSADPTIRFVDDDDAIASWSQQVSGFGTGAYENVYVRRIGVTDTTSERPVLLVSRLGLNTEPAMAIGSSGTQTMIWSRYGPAGQEIWFNQR